MKNRFLAFLLAITMTFSCSAICINALAQSDSDTALSAADGGEEYYNQLIEQYKEYEPTFNDNFAPFTDEKLFGEYSIESDAWITESLIDYENYPALSYVEEAVRQGDYAAAKQEYYEYYRDKFQNSGYGRNVTATTAQKNNALLLSENFHTDLEMISLIKLTDSVKEYQIDITDALSGLGDSGHNKISLTLAALKKDGLTGMFYSKDAGGGLGPVLDVYINGRKYSYEPIGDATISAASNKDTLYGMEEDILVEESYSTIDVVSKVDKYTKRGMLLFDISDYNVGDSVSAVLKLSGRMLESENSEKPASLRSFKDIVLLKGENTAWDEATVTWAQIPSELKSYDTEPGIRHGFQADIPYTDTHKAYLSTGIEAYGYNSARILYQTCKRWLEEDTIRTSSSLYVSDMTADFPSLVCGIIAYNPYFGPEEFTMFAKAYYTLADQAVVQWGASEESNNWGATNAVANITSGIVFSEFKDASAPIEDGGYMHGKLGGWLEVGKHRYAFSSNNFKYPDGSSIEVAVGYARYMVNLIGSRINTLCKNMNISIDELLSPEAKKSLEEYLIYLMDMTSPPATGGSWQHGQSQNETYEQSMSNYRSLAELLGNPYLIWICSGRELGEEPPYKSVAYDDANKLVMRADWHPNGVSAQINADGGRKSHGMSDDLALNVFAYGSYLLADPSTADYVMTNPETSYLHSTRAHNTVEINGISQKGGQTIPETTLTMPDGTEQTVKGLSGGVSGTLHPENREFNNHYNYVKAQTKNYKSNSQLSDNYTVWREVLFAEPEYFIVTDYIKPDNLGAQNSYSQYWHVTPELNLTVQSDGTAYTNSGRQANVIVSTVNNDNMQSIKGVGYYLGKESSADYVEYKKEKTGITTFQTVIYPLKQGDNASVSTEANTLDVSADSAGSFHITIDRGDGSKKEVDYYSVYDESALAMRSFADYRTDGQTAMVSRSQSGMDSVIIRNGTTLQNADGTNIINSKNIIPELGVLYTGSTLELNTSSFVTMDEYEAVSNSNIALNKQADSGDSYSSAPASNAFDGNVRTPWIGRVNNGENPWISVDLEEQYLPYMIKIVDNKYRVKYDIYYSDDGENWTLAEFATTNTMEENADDLVEKYLYMKPAKGRYIKLVAKTDETISINEIEVQLKPNGISLADLTIACEDELNSVKINGSEVEFFQKNGVVSFVSDESGSGSTDTETTTPGTTAPDKEHGGTVTVPDSGNKNPGGGSYATGGGATALVPNIPSNPDNTEQTGIYDSELNNHWGQNEIRSLISKGIVKGDGKSLNLKSAVTRAEFTALIVRVLGIEENTDELNFADVNKSDWYAGAVGAAQKIGLVDGFGYEFNPMGLLTREQMAKMLIEAYKYMYNQEQIESAEINYSDKDSISEWAVEYVAKATRLGLMNGMSNGNFEPEGTALREQAFVTIYRLLKQ